MGSVVPAEKGEAERVGGTGPQPDSLNNGVATGDRSSNVRKAGSEKSAGKRKFRDTQKWLLDSWVNFPVLQRSQHFDRLLEDNMEIFNLIYEVRQLVL